MFGIFKKKLRKERRKNLKLRKVIDENREVTKEARKTTSELVATINGDPDWLRRELLKELNYDKTGHSVDCISDNSG